jgi:predicted lysophospholipase L1 biosynthesis ABC-type transport system permease subunit
MMRQLTANIEKQVIEQTQPLFGADIRISGSEDTSVELIDRLRPYLSGVTYSWAERVEFSTTLFDREGKTGLINVIAYTGNYPQK